MNRAERRRQEKIDRRRHLSARRAGQVIDQSGPGRVIDGGILQEYQGAKGDKMSPKVPGRHRWIATAMYAMSDTAAAHAFDDTPKFMDAENLVMVAMGCFDCEQPLTPAIRGSECPAGDEWQGGPA